MDNGRGNNPDIQLYSARVLVAVGAVDAKGERAERNVKGADVF